MKAYTVIVHEAEEDETGYWAEVVELPGCFGSGETLDELKVDVQDAIELYLDVLKDNGWPFPEPQVIEEPELLRWQITVPQLAETE